MERSDDLRAVGLFAGFTPAELAIIDSRATRRSVAKGHVFFRLGDANRSLFVLTRGVVQVERPGTSENVLLAGLRPGQSFGEMSFIDGSRATATVTASDASDAREISHATLVALLAEHPGLCAKFWCNLALELKARLVETNKLVDDYADVQQVLIDNPALRDGCIRA
jgi:CRP-like cAMP-binding protein